MTDQIKENLKFLHKKLETHIHNMDKMSKKEFFESINELCDLIKNLQKEKFKNS